MPEIPQNLVGKVLALCSKHQRRHLFLLLILTTLSGLLQMITVASIMPFMAMVANPQVVQNNVYIARFFAFIGLNDSRQFLFGLGLTMLVALILSNGIATWSSWLFSRFCHTLGQNLSVKLFSSYLQEPYLFFLDRHSADLSQNILSESDRVTRGVLVPLTQILTRTASLVLVLGLLVFVNPTVTLTLFGGLTSLYGVIFLFLKKRLMALGKRTLAATRERFRLTSEVFGAIKYLKIQGLEPEFTKRFDVSAGQKATCDASYQAFSLIPKYVLEILAFGGMLGVVLHLINAGEDVAEILPLLGLYAFAFQRLTPQLQEVFNSASMMRFHWPSLEQLLEDLGRTETAIGRKHEGSDPANRIKFEATMSLKGITFQYPNAAAPTLNGIELTVSAGTFVGIAGASGVGKTTLVDIILGLLTPSEGLLVSDGLALSALNLESWQRNLGYVPQDIFLLDSSIAENIALGMNAWEIDLAAVEQCACIAQLHGFVTTELPKGYDTPIGERGVRLSGGQRQRIGIARALYRTPGLLILDEATSALDPVSEQAVLDAIAGLVPAVTVLLVTHRLETLKRCDVIHVLDRGRIVASGDYASLAASSSHFRDQLLQNNLSMGEGQKQRFVPVLSI